MDIPKKESPLALIGVVLGLIGTSVGIWSQVGKRNLEDQIGQIELAQRAQDVEIKRKQDERSQEVADRDYLLRVTDKVIAAMEPPRSAERQQVAAFLIDTLRDGVSQRRLRNALLSAAAPQVRANLELTIAEEAKFATVEIADQAAQAKGQPVAAIRLPGVDSQAAGTIGKLAVDIFWCEGPDGDRHRMQAEALFGAATASGQFGRVRVRPLPESVNRRPGYGIVGNIIRHQDVERAGAGQLLRLSVTVTGIARSFSMQQIEFPTKDYISAFLCTSG
ncbi:hypothetical protein [Sandarakinorhabdus sp.]|uniref:hypothetical protein n=1 Tax=Sandarakinorhabdus sp. TaxID=1916663 RepID=UPI003342BC01